MPGSSLVLSFWTPVALECCGLPPQYLIFYYANQIVNMLGDVTVLDIPKKGISKYPFLRCRRWVDINEPLDRFGEFQTSDGIYHNLLFFYESIPKFCYLCGRLNHTIKSCAERNSCDRSEVLPFGNWLRTENPKRKKKFNKKGSNPSKFSGRNTWTRGESSNTNSHKPVFRSKTGNNDVGNDLSMVPIEDGRSAIGGSASSISKSGGAMVITERLVPAERKNVSDALMETTEDKEMGSTQSSAASSTKVNNKEISKKEEIALGKQKALMGQQVLALGKGKTEIIKPIIMASGPFIGEPKDVSSNEVQPLKAFHRLKSKIVFNAINAVSSNLLLTEYASGQKRVEDSSEERNAKRSKVVPGGMECSQPTEKAREAIEPPCQE